MDSEEGGGEGGRVILLRAEGGASKQFRVVQARGGRYHTYLSLGHVNYQSHVQHNNCALTLLRGPDRAGLVASTSIGVAPPPGAPESEDAVEPLGYISCDKRFRGTKNLKLDQKRYTVLSWLNKGLTSQTKTVYGILSDKKGIKSDKKVMVFSRIKKGIVRALTGYINLFGGCIGAYRLGTLKGR